MSKNEKGLYRRFRKSRYFSPIVGLSLGAIVTVYATLLSQGLGNIAPDILRSLVDANAALIGFLGIITVFILTSYRDESRRLAEEFRRLEHQHLLYQRRGLDLESE